MAQDTHNCASRDRGSDVGRPLVHWPRGSQPRGQCTCAACEYRRTPLEQFRHGTRPSLAQPSALLARHAVRTMGLGVKVAFVALGKHDEAWERHGLFFAAPMPTTSGPLQPSSTRPRGDYGTRNRILISARSPGQMKMRATSASGGPSKRVGRGLHGMPRGRPQRLRQVLAIRESGHTKPGATQRSTCGVW
jgi:hypothetical protein